MVQLRYDAAKTLQSLNHTASSGDPFTGVFLKDSRDLVTRFDVILRFVYVCLLNLFFLPGDLKTASTCRQSNPDILQYMIPLILDLLKMRVYPP